MELKDLSCKNENIDLDEYIFFREKIKKSMTHPEWLGDFSKEDLTYLLSNGSKIWIYYLDNLPVCSMFLIPSDEKTLKKFDVKLDYHKVVDYGPMMVDPKYLGNGLQLKMLKELDKYSKEHNYIYAIATVHPENIYSLNNLVKDEFVLVNSKEFSRGLRNIYLKKL